MPRREGHAPLTNSNGGRALADPTALSLPAARHCCWGNNRGSKDVLNGCGHAVGAGGGREMKAEVEREAAFEGLSMAD